MNARGEAPRVLPFAQSAEESHFQCQNSPISLPALRRGSAVALIQSPVPLATWADDHDTDCISPTSRRVILRYYIESFTKLRTTNLENNSFLSSIVPF